MSHIHFITGGSAHGDSLPIMLLNTFGKNHSAAKCGIANRSKEVLILVLCLAGKNRRPARASKRAVKVIAG